jgi:hypothetical protein
MIRLKTPIRFLLLLAVSCCAFFSYPFKNEHFGALFSYKNAKKNHAIFGYQREKKSFFLEQKQAALIERVFKAAPPTTQDGLGFSIAGPKKIEISYNKPPKSSTLLKAGDVINTEIMRYAPPQ